MATMMKSRKAGTSLLHPLVGQRQTGMESRVPHRKCLILSRMQKTKLQLLALLPL